ncbi:hypothetical protein ACKLNR_000059 [Fusarium oxysporum f. sp. zingiberi]
MSIDLVFQSWYKGDDASKAGIAQEAFKSVKKHFEQSNSLSGDEKALLGKKSSLQDVEKAVSDAFAKYEAKSEASKTRKWLQKASESICHYGQVLDVFVQHHPEYVSLAWGLMKVMFISVVNHGETLKLLSKSLYEVAQRLPRIEHLSALYPTKNMKLAIESLYSCIMEFLLIAHSWCNESKFKHIYHSFTRPHELRYSDLLQRIGTCTDNINELATVGSQTELRVMHNTQSSKLNEIILSLQTSEKTRQAQIDGLNCAISRLEISSRDHGRKLDLIMQWLEASGLTINDLLTKIETFHSIQTSAQLDTNQKLSSLQLSQALATFSQSLEDPKSLYKHHLFLRNRRASGRGAAVSTNEFWLSPKLARWSSCPHSSLTIIRGSFTTRWAIQDFAIDIIQAVTMMSIPALWVLGSANKTSPNAMLSPADLSVAEDATQQRKQYPEKYDVPDENEVIISDEAATKIESTVWRWHPEEYWPDDDDDLDVFKQPTAGKLCPHIDESDKCGCVLPFRERKMSAFQRQQIPNDCYEFDTYNLESFRNVEVVKTLILHGEMDPILRSCAYEGSHLAKWWEHQECQCTSATLGWRRICENGIKMYMILNLLRYFPQTWDANGSPVDDYRKLKAYQQAARWCTESGYKSDIATYPHRDFLGIRKNEFRCYPRPLDVSRWKHVMRFDQFGFERYQKGLTYFDDSDYEPITKSSEKPGIKSGEESDDDSEAESSDDSSDESSAESSGESSDESEEVRNRFYKLEFYPYGLMSYEDFLNFEKPMGFQPLPSDIKHVRWILCQQGLPVELSDCILEHADYTPRGRLPVPGKPLHPQCTDELGRYLEHCWQLIVRCYMLGHELRDKMDIEALVREEVKDFVYELFKCECDGAYELLYGFDAEPPEDSEVES